MEYRSRTYRKMIDGKGMVSFPVSFKESDLLISVDEDSYSPQLKKAVYLQLLAIRGQLEGYILRDQEFQRTLIPHHLLPAAPRIARLMAAAAKRAGVGPMAAVAGAVAEVIGRQLMRSVKELIVENGGDIYFNTSHPLQVAIFAGKSPLSGKVGIKIAPQPSGCGVCTSSASVGPSLSFGQADAAVVISSSAALADAAATTLGNLVHCEKDFTLALQKVCKIKGVKGAVLILGDRLGALGDVELIAL
ncbi:MAG TPA: UPF0280 family protein [Syntrophaceticus sp.]|nr:UPF0280 family protein [Syntrophaceticus sp.]